MKRFATAAMTGMLVAFLPVGRAETVVLKPAFDTGIAETFAGANFGRSTALIVGANQQGGVGRMLVRFDFSAIPAGATITSVELQVTVDREASGGGTGVDHTLRRVLVDWGEGVKSGQRGAAATPGEATWQARQFSTASWSAPGGAVGADFSDTVSAVRKLNDSGVYPFSSTPALVADVQGWLANPASNFGWVLQSTAESSAGNVRRVLSKESPTGSPTLTVSYTVSPDLPPPVIASFHKVGSLVELKFHADAGNLYAVEYRDSLGPGSPWTLLTNIAAKLTSFDAVATDPNGGSGARFYRLGIVAQID